VPDEVPRPAIQPSKPSSEHRTAGSGTGATGSRTRWLRTACLLSKPSRRLVAVNVEYIGFTIEDRFVVGYGLDFAEKYRNLSYIAVLSGS
jgi:hypothetical protein